MSETPLYTQPEIENAVLSPAERALNELEGSVYSEPVVDHLDQMRDEARLEAQQLANSRYEKPEMTYTPEFQIPEFLMAYGVNLMHERARTIKPEAMNVQRQIFGDKQGYDLAA